jgi:chaperonin GroES
VRSRPSPDDGDFASRAPAPIPHRTPCRRRAAPQSGVVSHGYQTATTARRPRLEEGEQAIGGIIVPDSAREKPQRGTVIAAGAGRVTDAGAIVPLTVKAGDVILFGKYTSPEVTLDGEEYLIMREDDVLALVGDGTTQT